MVQLKRRTQTWIRAAVIAVAWLAAPACIHAQGTSLSTPVVVLRKSSSPAAAGTLVLPNDANTDCRLPANYGTCKPLLLQNGAINGANLAAALTITGATATDGRVVITPGNVASLASVVIPAVRASEPSLIIQDSTTGGTAQGISMRNSTGTAYLNIDSNGGSTTPRISSNTGIINFIGANPVGAIVKFDNLTGSVAIASDGVNPNTGSTFDLGESGLRWATVYGVTGNFSSGAVIGSGTGAIKVTSGTVGLVSGTATDCVLVNGGSGSCGALPITTTGDIIYSSSGTTAARLGIGSSGQCLTVSGGIPAWASCGSGANTTLSNLTSPTAINQDLIPSGTRSIGSTSAPFAATYATTSLAEGVFIATPASSFVSQWRLTVPTSSTFRLASGAGAQNEMQVASISSSDTQFGIRGSIYPLSVSGSNGDLGYTGSPWRDAFLSGTLTVNTAIAGTFNMSGNETVTGNLYLRTFSGGDASCGGVANGWFGLRTDNNEYQGCNGTTTRTVPTVAAASTPFTGSGTCSITAIENGIVTGASC